MSWPFTLHFRDVGLTFWCFRVLFRFKILLVSTWAMGNLFPEGGATAETIFKHLRCMLVRKLTGLTAVQSRNRATSFVSSFKRQGRMPAVVDYVAADSRIKYGYLMNRLRKTFRWFPSIGFSFPEAIKSLPSFLAVSPLLHAPFSTFTNELSE